MAFSHSPVGMSKATLETDVADSPPNKSNWPIASARFVSITESIASR
ncbi:unannotated protein [freshwater metagenome]|uniref:Unannotated protein n=1 Tax=freshwater metagenome TaxID=449393 RepID=A0A6J7RVU2_9ZZZZ